MLTTKKRGRDALAIVAAACLLLTACRPPGVRALRRGDQLVQSGKYAQAIEALTQATNLLAKDDAQPQAKARNLLGLAYHGMSNAASARVCYREALALDRTNAAEADFNLGCLELEQTNLAGARDALTTYTTLRERDWNGFLKLGVVNYRLANLKIPAPTESARQLDFDNARKAFGASIRLKPTPEAWNNVGMIDLLRRPNPSRAIISNAVAEFKAALGCESNYAPALLNLAVVDDPGGPYKYGDVQTAINAYRQYLALDPPPPHAAEIRLLVKNLDTTMRLIVQYPGHPPEPAVPVIPSSSNRLTVVMPSNPIPRPPTPPPTPPIPPPPPPAPAASNPATVAILQVPRPVEPPPPRPAAGNWESNTPVLPSSGGPAPVNSNTPALAARGGPPPVRSNNTPVLASRGGPAPGGSNTAAATASTNVALTSTAVSKPSFWSRLFGGKPKPVDVPPSVPAAPVAPVAAGNPAGVTPLPAPHTVLHYAAPPVSARPGNRAQAERLAREGAAAERESRLKEAMASYQEAVKTDPTYYEACEALGMAAIKSEEFTVALEALHHALALNPDSGNARYGYAWALEKKDYFQDAANELEKLLAQHPEETRAHLLLGNLYAQRLGQPDFARGHYKKVLEQDPRSDQAPALRAWLQNNPEP